MGAKDLAPQSQKGEEEFCKSKYINNNLILL